MKWDQYIGLASDKVPTKQYMHVFERCYGGKIVYNSDKQSQ